MLTQEFTVALFVITLQKTSFVLYAKALTEIKQLFALWKNPRMFLQWKEQGILVRHFSNPIIEDYNRITIGTIEQMKVFLQAVDFILNEGKDA